MESTVRLGGRSSFQREWSRERRGRGGGNLHLFLADLQRKQTLPPARESQRARLAPGQREGALRGQMGGNDREQRACVLLSG
jgi:hypothetical protein